MDIDSRRMTVVLVFEHEFPGRIATIGRGPVPFVVAPDCRPNGPGYLFKRESGPIVSVGDGFLANFSESFRCRYTMAPVQGG
jgi:hypothetical protein